MDEALPFVDSIAVVVPASPEVVWPALLATVERTYSGAVAGHYARLVGCADPDASGPRPLAEGSTVPGFRVVSAIAPAALVLEGRHRFSHYRLALRIDRRGEGESELRAETRAAFPGLAGRVYRLLVIESGGHRMAVRRFLATVARTARSD